jgi:hypothetical protein
MTEDETTAAAFELRLREVLDAYGRPFPSKSALCAWWLALRPFDWPVVDAALTEHLALCRFPPVPADIVGRISAHDGRPGPEEAWSIALAADDEAATVVWTAEIAAARAVAEPILAARDEVGARKAFLEVYTRVLAEARRQLRPVGWEVSLGTDPARRVAALCDAERAGRLRPDLVQRLLPPDTQLPAGAPTGPVSIAGLLTGSVAALPPDRVRDQRRFVAAVREGLARAAADRAAERARVAEQRRVRAAQRRLQEALRAHQRFVLARRVALRKQRERAHLDAPGGCAARGA